MARRRSYHGIFIIGAHWHDLSNRVTGNHPHPHEYENQVERTLSAVWANPVGRILISRLVARQGGHGISIVPYRGAALNAWTHSVDNAGGTMRGQPQRDPQGNPIANLPPGTGTGSSIRIAFTPGMWSHGANAPFDPATVLIHELVHALRATRGHGDRLPRGNNYDNLEEFYAVTIENIFSSANHRILLRPSHRATPEPSGDPFDWLGSFIISDGGNAPEPLPPLPPSVPGSTALSVSQSWRHAAGNPADLARLIVEEPDVCQLIARVGCAFNPIHDALGLASLRSQFRNLPRPPRMP